MLPRKDKRKKLAKNKTATKIQQTEPRGRSRFIVTFLELGRSNRMGQKPSNWQRNVRPTDTLEPSSNSLSVCPTAFQPFAHPPLVISSPFRFVYLLLYYARTSARWRVRAYVRACVVCDGVDLATQYVALFPERRVQIDRFPRRGLCDPTLPSSIRPLKSASYNASVYLQGLEMEVSPLQ